MPTKTQSWYSSWFDSPYYHILYKDRDFEEAQMFMQNLTRFLELKDGASVLDLACGRGRHSKYLNKLGYNVTGIDLSENSISYAKKYENEQLHFKVHDMRKPIGSKFDAVLNLFTSFGYFEDWEDDFRTIEVIKKELKRDGFGVIDFLNVNFVMENLIPSEVIRIKEIDFHILRWVENGIIFKQIDFTHQEEHFSYIEKVNALQLSDFQKYFELANLKLLHVFGDYNLSAFHEKNSARTILIFSR